MPFIITLLVLFQDTAGKKDFSAYILELYSEKWKLPTVAHLL